MKTLLFLSLLGVLTFAFLFFNEKYKRTLIEDYLLLQEQEEELQSKKPLSGSKSISEKKSRTTTSENKAEVRPTPIQVPLQPQETNPSVDYALIDEIESEYLEYGTSPFFDEEIFQEDVVKLLEMSNVERKAFLDWKEMKHNEMLEKLKLLKDTPELMEEKLFELSIESNLGKEFEDFVQENLGKKQHTKLIERKKLLKQNREEVELNHDFLEIIGGVPNINDEQKDLIWKALDENRYYGDEDGTVDFDKIKANDLKREKKIKEILSSDQYEQYENYSY